MAVLNSKYRGELMRLNVPTKSWLTCRGVFNSDDTILHTIFSIQFKRFLQRTAAVSLCRSTHESVWNLLVLNVEEHCPLSVTPFLFSHFLSHWTVGPIVLAETIDTLVSSVEFCCYPVIKHSYNLCNYYSLLINGRHPRSLTPHLQRYGVHIINRLYIIII